MSDDAGLKVDTNSGTLANARTLFGTLPSGLLAPRSVTAEMLATGAVTSRAVADDAITGTQLASALKNLVVDPFGAGRQIQTGTDVVTTNGSGRGSFTFGATFVSTPIVIVCHGDTTAADGVLSVPVGLVSTTGFTVQLDHTDGTGVWAGAGIRVNWIAMT